MIYNGIMSSAVILGSKERRKKRPKENEARGIVQMPASHSSSTATASVKEGKV